MASTVVYGRMQSFVPSTESISAYLERLDLYFTANGIESEKQVPVLLTVIGPENYTLLRGLVAPAAPKDKTLEELKASLTNHFKPKTLVIAERFRFYRRTQIVGESVAEFVLAALRKLSIHCKFGDFLDEALRDRLVCGLRDVWCVCIVCVVSTCVVCERRGVSNNCRSEEDAQTMHVCN